MLSNISKRPKELKGLKPIVVTREKNYLYTKIEFFVVGKTMFVKLSAHREKARWLKIENIDTYSAREVAIGTDLGRHFEEGIFKIYEKLNLDLGFFKNGLRRIDYQ